MIFIDKQQIAQLIQAEHVNFIGSAVTPWHAHGVDCAISYLKSRGIAVNGVILVKPAIKGSQVDYIIDERNFVTQSCKLYKLPAVYDTRISYIVNNIIELYKASSWYNQQSKSNDKEDVYIANPWHLDVDLFKYLYRRLIGTHTFRLMLIEEGLATYFPASKSYHQQWITANKDRSIFRRSASFLLNIVGSKLNRRFQHLTKWINLNLLIERSDGLVPNEQAISLYRPILRQYALLCERPVVDIGESVIICTMAYKREEVNEDADSQLLRAIVDELKSIGITVCIKPHPRETDYKSRYSTLGCTIIDAPCSVETLLSLYPQIKGIISYSSTALVTATLLFGKKSISIINMLDQKQYGEYIQGEMLSFCQCFGNIVEMPNDLTEFRASIKSLNT